MTDAKLTAGRAALHAKGEAHMEIGKLTGQEHAVLRRTQERMSKPAKRAQSERIPDEVRRAVGALASLNAEGDPFALICQMREPLPVVLRWVRQCVDAEAERAQTGASETLAASPVGDATRLPVPAAPGPMTPDVAALRKFVARYVTAMLACAGMRRASDRDAKRQLGLKADAAGRVLDSALVALEARDARTPCGVCGGSGKPVSGLPCVCGGVGTQDAELEGTRKELFDFHFKLGYYPAVKQTHELVPLEELHALREARLASPAGRPDDG